MCVMHNKMHHEAVQNGRLHYLRALCSVVLHRLWNRAARWAGHWGKRLRNHAKDLQNLLKCVLISWWGKRKLTWGATEQQYNLF